MHVLFIEPFYAGSHKSWLDQLIHYSTHTIDTITQPGRFWKWRMYGSAYTLASETLSKLNGAHTSGQAYDLILVSDMMDVAAFIAFLRPYTSKHSISIGMYFHENQWAYPWQESSEDKQLNRDVHYGMMNYNSALASDFLLFNSAYNRDTFMKGCQDVLSQMPDCQHKESIGILHAKSHILPIGILPKSTTPAKDLNLPSLHPVASNIPNVPDIPIILWNHRMEHDKNPKAFFDCLIRIAANWKEPSLPFQLVLIGESNTKALKRYAPELQRLSPYIIKEGYCSSEEYRYWLERSTLLPVTSLHDFFGISIMEAVLYGTYPLLPRRLTYPDLYHEDVYPELFYDNTSEDFYQRLNDILIHSHKESLPNYSHLALPYVWTSLIHDYDTLFTQLAY